PSQTVDPPLRKLNMICGVQGSPGNIATEPTWSNRKPAGTALACASGFFTCAQPDIPARAAATINNANEGLPIPTNPEKSRCSYICVLNYTASYNVILSESEESRINFG